MTSDNYDDEEPSVPSTTAAEEDLERLRDRGVPVEEAAATIRLKHADEEAGLDLFDLPGITLEQAHGLRVAGFRTVARVAAATQDALTAARGVGKSTAAVVQDGAEYLAEHGEHPAELLARETTEDQDTLRERVDTLARYGVPPTDAVDSLRQLVGDDPSCNLLSVDGVGPVRAHYLLDAGYDSVEAVAEATRSELLSVKYIGEQTGPEIHDGARSFVGAPEADGTDSSTEEGRAGASEFQVIADSYPEGLVERDQWLVWAPDADRSKVPRAPWNYGGDLRFASGTDPENWQSFEGVMAYAERHQADLKPGFRLTEDDPFLLLDYDDVIADGELHPTVAEHLERLESYAAVSSSGTGVHLLLEGELEGDTTQLKRDLDGETEASVEVYGAGQFVALTGDRIQSTPTEPVPAPGFVDELQTTPQRTDHETTGRRRPRREKRELTAMETTDDMQDVFDAIHHVDPSDIRLRSERTEVRPDGTASYDPLWATSESGTRLGELPDGWVYRKGMVGLNALHVVALEEGIVHDVEDYPDGEDFWDALAALRDRGAAIPYHSSELDERTEMSTDPETVDRDAIREILKEGEAGEVGDDLQAAVVALDLSAAAAKRTAEVYVRARDAGIVAGSATEAILGASIRLAASDVGEPRPWAAIAGVLDCPAESMRRKQTRILRETDVTESIEASSVYPEAQDLLPFLARKLDFEPGHRIVEDASQRLDSTEITGSASPWSLATSAVYAAALEDDWVTLTQEELAAVAGLSSAAIREHYGRFTQDADE